MWMRQWSCCTGCWCQRDVRFGHKRRSQLQVFCEEDVSVANQPKRWTRAEIRVRGVRLSYLERETGAPAKGAPMLLLHGLVAGGDCFRRLGDELPEDRRVVALDMPGGGYSDRPCDGNASFRGTAELVAEAITALKMERPVILGHSYGGAITLGTGGVAAGTAGRDDPDCSGASVFAARGSADSVLSQRTGAMVCEPSSAISKAD